LDFNTFAELSQAFTGPCVALGGAFIAAASLRVSRSKSQRDLFDKRLAIYNSVSDALASGWVTGVITLEQSRQFLAGMRQAELLFSDARIDTFLKHMRDEVMQLLVLENLDEEMIRRRRIIEGRIHPNGRLREDDLRVVSHMDFPWMMPMAVLWNAREEWHELTVDYFKLAR